MVEGEVWEIESAGVEEWWRLSLAFYVLSGLILSLIY